MLASGSLLLVSAGEFCPDSLCATANAANSTTSRSAQALRNESDFISFTPGKFCSGAPLSRRVTQTALRGRVGAPVAQNSFDYVHRSRGNKGAITYHTLTGRSNPLYIYLHGGLHGHLHRHCRFAWRIEERHLGHGRANAVAHG